MTPFEEIRSELVRAALAEDRRRHATGERDAAIRAAFAAGATVAEIARAVRMSRRGVTLIRDRAPASSSVTGELASAS